MQNSWARNPCQILNPLIKSKVTEKLIRALEFQTIYSKYKTTIIILINPYIQPKGCPKVRFFFKKRNNEFHSPSTVSVFAGVSLSAQGQDKMKWYDVSCTL